jgi:hypothetical protein
VVQSRAEPALDAVEISGLAWAAAVDAGIRAHAAHPGVDAAAYEQSAGAKALAALEPGDAARLEAELRAAGITGPDNQLAEHWRTSVLLAVTAAVRVSVVAATAEYSMHTDLALSEGLGLAVSYRRQARTTAAGEEVMDVRDAVELVRFDEPDAWAALRRTLPDLAELLASPGSAGWLEGERTPISRTELLNLPDAVLPPDVKTAVLTPRCRVHLEVTADRPGPTTVFHAADVWALADRLYAVRTADGGQSLVLVHVPSGDLLRQLQWRLLGAREALAGASAPVVRG